MFAKEKPEGSLEETISNCSIGEFGICIDDASETGKFRYLIAGVYKEGTVPEGMTVYEIPETEWAKFKCKGPLPGALQAVNTKIFKEWLPGNPEYEMSLGINIEWYSIEGKTTDADYESAIWIPVKRK
jgi:AraC family transcriptional regulator